MKRKLNISDLERSKEKIKEGQTFYHAGRFDEVEETEQDFLNSGMSEEEANFATSNVIDYDNIY